MLTKGELSAKVGEQIKLLRLEQNISQAELGRLCDKDRQHIELIENSKISANIYTLHIIASALQVDIKELFQFNDQQ